MILPPQRGQERPRVVRFSTSIFSNWAASSIRFELVHYPVAYRSGTDLILPGRYRSSVLTSFSIAESQEKNCAEN